MTSLTKNNIRFIEKNRLKMSGSDMAIKFGVGKGVVNRYMRKNGLAAPRELQLKFRSSGNIGKTTSTPAVDKILKKTYLIVNVNQLSIKIGRSETFVKNRLRQLGLIIPPEIIQQRIKESRIQPGSVPVNKGKKMLDYLSKESYESIKTTWFKKGHLPANTKEKNGAISIRLDHADRSNSRPYKYIRIQLGVWEPLHKHRWEKKHGAIPTGHCLWFKDGNTMNCKLKNLELITRAENLKRNRAKYLELPPELRTANRLIKKLNKTIYGKEQIK